MNEKLKWLTLSIVGIAVLAVIVGMGVHYFGPQKRLPPAAMVSIADLVRQEKKDPSVLTDDQRRLLAAIPDNEKQQLATKTSFSLSQVPHKKP